jgi:hypothetical protein
LVTIIIIIIISPPSSQFYAQKFIEALMIYAKGMWFDTGRNSSTWLGLLCDAEQQIPMSQEGRQNFCQESLHSPSKVGY